MVQSVWTNQDPRQFLELHKLRRETNRDNVRGRSNRREKRKKNGVRNLVKES